MTTPKRGARKTKPRRLRVKRETIRDLDARKGSVRGGSGNACAVTQAGICGPTVGCPPPPPNLGKTAACVKI